MTTYLLFIGTMNALGTLLLLGALNEGFADGLLRRWTYIIPRDVPYQHSEYSRLWLWWAIVGTSVFAFLNIVAASWPAEFATWIVIGDVWAYACFEALAIAGTLSTRFDQGLWVAHILWIGQGGWGAMVVGGVV